MLPRIAKNLIFPVGWIDKESWHATFEKIHLCVDFSMFVIVEFHFYLCIHVVLLHNLHYHVIRHSKYTFFASRL